jgi:peptidase E
MNINLKPTFLIAGGRGQRRKSPDPLLQGIFREFAIPSPSIAYVGVASGDDRSFFTMISAMLKEGGAGKIDHALIAPERSDLKKARKILEEADIVFVSGGDVEAGMDVLNEKKLTGFIRDLYKQEKPFFGISAGSIMLAREWVRWRNPDDDSTAEIFPCLGIAPVVCDTHAEGDNWEELKALLALEKNGAEGFGIASGTAIKVYPDGQVQGLGGTVARFARRADKVIKVSEMLPPGE